MLACLLSPLWAADTPSPMQVYAAAATNPVTHDVELVVSVTAPSKTKTLRIWMPAPRATTCRRVSPGIPSAAGVGRLMDDTRFTDHPNWTYDGFMATTPSQSRITVEPGKCGGRPCIRHMRIRVKDVLEMLASGASEDQILSDYPDLEREDIRACLEYAAQYFDHPVFVG